MNAAERTLGFGRVVAFYPALAAPLGGVKAALLFCQLYYWHRQDTDPRGVYKSRQDLESETGLSYKEQRKARQALIDRGVLVEHHDYSAHRIYFQINMARVAECLNWRPMDPPPDEYLPERQLPCPECAEYLPKGQVVVAQRASSSCPNVNQWLPKGHSLLYKITEEITDKSTPIKTQGAPAGEERASVTEVTHERDGQQGRQQPSRQTRHPSAKAEQRKLDIEAVFEYWQRVMRHPDAKLTEDRRSKINARLAEGFTPAKLCAAIDGCASSPHHMGKNDTGTRYDSIGLIFRSGEKTEWFAAMRSKLDRCAGDGPRSAIGRFLAGDDISAGSIIEGSEQ